MTLKIEKRSDEANRAMFSLSGRIQSEHLAELSLLLQGERCRIVLDLSEVFLADREAIRFLAACEAEGYELRNCPAFVREWIIRERRVRSGLS